MDGLYNNKTKKLDIVLPDGSGSVYDEHDKKYYVDITFIGSKDTHTIKEVEFIEKEKYETIKEFAKTLVDKQKDLPEDIAKIVNERFTDLLD